jgi:hypothetical protein
MRIDFPQIQLGFVLAAFAWGYAIFQFLGASSATGWRATGAPIVALPERPEHPLWAGPD